MLRWKKLQTIVIVLVVVLVWTTIGLAQESTYDVVNKRGKLIAAVKNDFPPAGYINKEGEVVGFDIDIAKYIAQKMGVTIELKPVTSQTRIPLLINGNVDLVVATMNPTKERAKVIDFSMSYFKGGTTFLVHKDSGIRSIDDLKAPRKTGATQGSSDIAGFLILQPKGEAVYFQEFPQAVMALKSHRIDAVCTTDITLHRLNQGDPNYVVIQPPFKLDPYAIGVRHNDSKWRLFIDVTIMEMYANGTLAKVYKEHVGSPIPYTIDLWPDISYKK